MADLTPPADILSASPEAVEAVQSERLAAQVERLRTRHPYYRALLRDLGDPPIATVQDLQDLPLTLKADLGAQPDAFRLEPADPADPADILWDIAYTSGSTAAPTPLYQTAQDFRGILEAQRRMALIRGMTAQDKIANLYPLTAHPHGAWMRATHAAAALGAELVVAMPGTSTAPYQVTRRTPEVLELLAHSQPTVLWGVPSYLKRLLEAAEHAGVVLSRVRMLAVSGEACTPAMVQALTDLSRRVGSPDVVVSNSLGASEMQCGLVECETGTGFHNPAPEQFFLETVDEGGRRVPEGDPGRLALTHLDRRGTALLRYVLGDVVVLTNQPCPVCGRTGGRIVSHHHREGSMVKVRGSLFDSQVLVRTVAEFPGVREFQAVVRPERSDDPLSMDVLELRVAPLEGGVDSDQLVAAVARAVRVTPEVRLVELADLDPPGASLKPRRFVDRRHQEEQ